MYRHTGGSLENVRIVHYPKSNKGYWPERKTNHSLPFNAEVTYELPIFLLGVVIKHMDNI
jgi:hypothetical protein